MARLKTKIADITTSPEYASLSPANQTIVNDALNLSNPTSTVNNMLSYAKSVP
jgi:hypothetical protein